MDDKPILILGGYGNAGFSIADYVLKMSQKKLILAARRADKARFAAGDLNVCYIGSGWDYRVEGIALDASNKDALQQACDNASLLIVAANITAHIDSLLDVILAKRVDALFISPHPAVQAAIDARAVAVQQAGICIIAQAGLLPGLPAALIRHYSQEVPTPSRASVSLLRRFDWQALNLSDDSLRELLDTWRSIPRQVYRQGQWRSAHAWRGDYAKVTFAQQRRAVACVPQALRELTILSEQLPFKDLRSLDMTVSRFNSFVDWLVLPFIGAPQREMSARLLKRLRWGLENLSQTGSYAQMQVTLQGPTAPHHSGNYQKTLHAQISHRNAYELTGISVAACVKQYLSGDLRKPGVWLQGMSVDTAQLLADMQAQGADISVATEVK